MKTLTQTLLLLLVAFLSCSASTIEYVTFVNATNPDGTFTNNGTPNVYVGPYHLTLLDETSSILSDVYAPCMSDNLSISGGETWYGTKDSLTGFPWPSTPILNALHQMAWLDTQFAAAETANDSPNVAGIQQAIWDLGNQISGLSFTYTDPTTVAWVNDAIANYGAQSVAFYSQFSVLIPSSPDTVSGAALPITDVGGSTPTGTPQFFMVEVGDTPPVPEPATFVLIGSGLLFFGLFKRRKSA